MPKSYYKENILICIVAKEYMVALTTSMVIRNEFSPGVRTTMMNVLKRAFKVEVRKNIALVIKMKITAKTAHC